MIRYVPLLKLEDNFCLNYLESDINDEEVCYVTRPPSLCRH